MLFLSCEGKNSAYDECISEFEFALTYGLHMAHKFLPSGAVSNSL